MFNDIDSSDKYSEFIDENAFFDGEFRKQEAEYNTRQ